MYKKEEVRALLSETAQVKFDDIVCSRVLGANAHITIIGEILLDITQQDTTKQAKLDQIRKVASYFQETRGQNSRAIYHAISLYLKGVMQVAKEDETKAIHLLCEQILNYKQQAAQHLATLVSYGVHLCEQMDTIMIFDYSSTVDAFVQALPAGMHIYIPESRALDGGRPYVAHALQAGHDVHFIPDTAMLSALKTCQAAFMGAETCYPDGTVFNTIGSDMLGVLCHYLCKPLYVLTPMIKIDTRPVYGYVRLNAMPFDYGIRLGETWEENTRNKVDFHGYKLLEVTPAHITAYICEQGILSSGALFQAALAYAKELEEEA